MARKLQGTWLDNYIAYTDDTESPIVYKLWAGIHAISATLKKHVFMRRDYDIFANQFIVLVGPPGIGKGNAMKPSIDLVEKAGTGNYIPDRTTAEKVIEKLANGFTGVTIGPSMNGLGTKVMTVGDSSATIVSTELPVLISASDWMLPLLCELWDKGKFTYDTKTKGTLNATGVCTGLFGGCVPDYIRKINKDAMAAVTGGFSSRCIFVYADTKSKNIPWPDCKQGSQLELDLIEDLKHVAGMQGEIKWHPDALAEYKKLYVLVSEAAKNLESEVELHFNSRILSHILKTAMSISISESDNMLIETHHLRQATVLVNAVSTTLESIFRGLGDSPLAGMIDRVLRFLEMRPGGCAKRSDIFKSVRRHMTDENLTMVGKALQDSNEIAITPAGITQIWALTTFRPRN